MNNPTKGIDVSFSTLTPKACKALWKDGVRVFWQCLWTGSQTPATAATNLQIAKEFGFIICGYISVTSSHNGYWHFANGRNAVSDEIWDALALVVCDVELQFIPNQAIRDCVEAIYHAGKRRAIYTSYNAWVANQGDPHTFTDCLLCNALWDNNEDFDFPSLPYGGWLPKQVVCEQYTGGGDVFGVNADRDVWDGDLLKGDTRVVYTDEKLTEIFTELLKSIAHSLDIGVTTANALIQHVNSHPGGGATITMAGELAPLVEKVNALEADLAKFKTAIAVAAVANG